MADTASPSGDMRSDGESATEEHPPAAFLVRLGATLVDGVLLLGLAFFLTVILCLPVFGYLPYEVYPVPVLILFLVIPLLYFSLYESAPRQATLGKAAFGLVVTDRNGRRISRLRAIGRFLAKWISVFPLVLGGMGITIGMASGLPIFSPYPEAFPGIINRELVLSIFIFLLGIVLVVAWFAVGSRGLHDILAGTRVSYRTPAHRDSRDIRILLEGVLVCFLIGILVFGITVGPAMYAAVTAPPDHHLFPLPVTAITQRQGDALYVIWRGGPENDRVEGYRIMLEKHADTRDPTSMSYPEPDGLYPPETGNWTRFGAENAGLLHVKVVAIMADGQTQWALDTFVDTRSLHSPCPWSQINVIY